MLNPYSLGIDVHKSLGVNRLASLTLLPLDLHRGQQNVNEVDCGP